MMAASKPDPKVDVASDAPRAAAKPAVDKTAAEKAAPPLPKSSAPEVDSTEAAAAAKRKRSEDAEGAAGASPPRSLASSAATSPPRPRSASPTAVRGNGGSSPGRTCASTDGGKPAPGGKRARMPSSKDPADGPMLVSKTPTPPPPTETSTTAAAQDDSRWDELFPEEPQTVTKPLPKAAAQTPVGRFNQPVFGSSPLVGTKAFGAVGFGGPSSTGKSLFGGPASTGKSLFGAKAAPGGAKVESKPASSAPEPTAAAKTFAAAAAFSFSKYKVPSFGSVSAAAPGAAPAGAAAQSAAESDEIADFSQVPSGVTAGFASPIKKRGAAGGAAGATAPDAADEVARAAGVTLLEQRQNKLPENELCLFECMAKIFTLEGSGTAGWSEKGAGSVMMLVARNGLGGGRIVGHRLSTGRLLLNARILPGPLVAKDAFLTFVGLAVHDETGKPEHRSFLIKPLRPTGEERLLARHYEQDLRRACPFDLAPTETGLLRAAFVAAYDAVTESLATQKALGVDPLVAKEAAIRQVLRLRAGVPLAPAGSDAPAGPEAAAESDSDSADSGGSPSSD